MNNSKNKVFTTSNFNANPTYLGSASIKPPKDLYKQTLLQCAKNINLNLPLQINYKKLEHLLSIYSNLKSYDKEIVDFAISKSIQITEEHLKNTKLLCNLIDSANADFTNRYLIN